MCSDALFLSLETIRKLCIKIYHLSPLILALALPTIRSAARAAITVGLRRSAEAELLAL